MVDCPSTARVATSAPGPPSRPAQPNVPPASSFQTNASPKTELLPTMDPDPSLVRGYVPGPGSKSAVPLKKPAAYTFPAASAATLLTWSSEPEPRRWAQTKLPSRSSFQTNALRPPDGTVNGYVSGPGSKSTVPVKYPVAYTFPAPSTVNLKA